MANPEQTIVIKRAKKRGGGAHGGSWKIAFADFALAMMAFFLVLWLMESTTELEKQVIAGYFSDPRSLADIGDGGTPYVLDLGGRPLDLANQGLDLALVRENQEQMVSSPPELEEPEYTEMARLRQVEALDGVATDLQEALEDEANVEWYDDNILVQQTEQGLMIQIIDRENRPLFDSGQDQLRPFARQLMWVVADILAAVPNRVSIYGHTDSIPFSDNMGEYTNWELSSDRANAARRALIEGGMDYEQFFQIIGMGSSVPFDEEDTTAPANRRIAVLVMNKLTEQRLQQSIRTSTLWALEEESEIPEPPPTPEIF